MKTQILKYKPSHYKAIASWYKARDLTPPSKSSLSTLGYIVDDRVAGWLYLTNSNVAEIEGVISNPYTTPAGRRHSLKKLAGVLVDIALSLGYTIIKVNTNHPNIEQLCKDMGFKEHNLKTFILNEETEEDYERPSSVYEDLFKEIE